MSSNNTSNLTSAPIRTFYLLKQAEFFTKFQMDAKLREFQLTGAQYTSLSLLNRPDPLSSAQLARRFYTSPQATNEIVTNLERKELIERHEDPENRRVLRIKLTDKGREMLKACDKIVDELENEFFGSLTKDELSGLRSSLSKIIQSHLDIVKG